MQFYIHMEKWINDKRINKWSEIKWKPVQRYVIKLQRKIYKLSLDGERSKVHTYQKKLLGSKYSKLLAIRRVTQDNRGKKTS